MKWIFSRCKEICHWNPSFGSDNFFYETPPGSSCYNFHVFKHINYHANKESKTPFFSPHKTRLIPLLIKISESFEIQVNILEILRNDEQSLKKCNNFPKVGVSCYSTWGKLLHLIKIVLYRQFGPAKYDTIRFTGVCGDMWVYGCAIVFVSLCVVLFVCPRVYCS